MREEMYGPILIGGPCARCGISQVEHVGLDCVQAKAQRDEAVSKMLTPILKEILRPKKRFEALTKRQYEVLEYIAAGHSNKDMVVLMKCGKKTVEKHRMIAMKKAGLRNAAQVTAYILSKKTCPHCGRAP